MRVFRKSLITYENAVLKAQQEVEDGLVALPACPGTRGLSGRECRRGAASPSTSRERSTREGARDFTVVLIAQQALLREQDSLTVTLGAVSAGLVAVYRALGGGWEMREGHDFVPPDVREMMTKRTELGWSCWRLRSLSLPVPDKETARTINLPAMVRRQMQ